MPLTSADCHGLSRGVGGTGGYGDGRAELDGNGRTPQRENGFLTDSLDLNEVLQNSIEKRSLLFPWCWLVS